MGLGDVLGKVGVNLPSDVGAKAVGFFQGIIMFVLVAIVVAIVTYWYINKRSYNKTIDIFTEVNGISVPIGQDFAREITLPFTSIRAFFLRKRKIFLPRGYMQVGANRYWYFIRDDGEWANIGMGNLNDTLTELGIKYDHTDMRMANASLKKLIEKNYKKTSWLKEWAPYIGFAILILMLGVAGYMIFSQIGDNLGGMSTITDKQDLIMDKIARLLGETDKIANSGVREI